MERETGAITQRHSLPPRGPKAMRLSAYRSLEKQEKQYHVNLIDRSAEAVVPPPFIVAVVGPPGVGKSTLIQSLVKNWTKQNLGPVVGPVTVVTGKKRRITLIECPNDMNAMCDVAKIADLALLLVDGSFGFQMETFEFLNMCQVHGFPRVIGCLTHLDGYKNMATLRRVKKQMKQRFWTDIYEGCKLFYLSGIKHNRYPKVEVSNLSRFISVLKFRPLIWRNSHPSVLADRVEVGAQIHWRISSSPACSPYCPLPMLGVHTHRTQTRTHTLLCGAPRRSDVDKKMTSQRRLGGTLVAI